MQREALEQEETIRRRKIIRNMRYVKVVGKYKSVKEELAVNRTRHIRRCMSGQDTPGFIAAVETT